jgi:uncharacterized protein (TIGR02266 family)
LTTQDDTVRVRLRYPDLDTFVEKFAPNVTRGGIFLASRDPRPVGQVLRFEVLLRQGGPVLSGQGRVTWVKEFNPAEPHRPYGMGVQFMHVDPQARGVLDRLLQKKQPRPSPLPQPIASPGRARLDVRPTERTPLLGEPLEDDLDEAALRRTLERARVLSARTDDLEALLATPATDEPPPTLAQALVDLPRLLAGRRPTTGSIRLLQDTAALEESHSSKKGGAS